MSKGGIMEQVSVTVDRDALVEIRKYLSYWEMMRSRVVDDEYVGSMEPDDVARDAEMELEAEDGRKITQVIGKILMEAMAPKIPADASLARLVLSCEIVQ